MDDVDEIYAMRRPSSPWGDYGSILFHGMTMRLGRKSEPNGELQLERAGPSSPPIFFPAEGVLVTDEMKSAMEQANFTGVEFRTVELTRIVEIDWETWNLNASEPKFYPDGGSPELYILNRDHSQTAANQMGPIWELVVVQNAKMSRIETDDDVIFEYMDGTWQGNDIFRTDANGLLYVSPRAKEWFVEHAPAWVQFQNGRRHSMNAE